MTRRVPFMTLTPGEDAVDVRNAIDRVVTRGWFVLGPEVEAFETEFAEASRTAAAVGVGSGTDAIALTLRALGIGTGDEVITAPLSAAFSALAIMMAGARPVFADLDPVRLTMDPAAVEAAITPRTAAVLPVHLYGQPADMARLADVARRHGLALIEDACQAHLATCGGRPVGTFGAAGAFSFYPTKNLGALGDGGAVATNDRGLADRLRRLRNGGQSAPFEHEEFGVNSRLDEIQAAVLRGRLARLPGWIDARRALAASYRRALDGSSVRVPEEVDPGHVYHLFPVLAPDRVDLRSHLTAREIGSDVHYPRPLPRQHVFAGQAPAVCPVADHVSREVCSLPLHPRLTDDDISIVAAGVRGWR